MALEFILVLVGLALNLVATIAFGVLALRRLGPAKQHADLTEFVDEGITLAESASRLSAKTGGGKLTSLDKRREAVAHAASRARLAKIKITDAELAKMVEIRLNKRVVEVVEAAETPAPTVNAPAQ